MYGNFELWMERRFAEGSMPEWIGNHCLTVGAVIVSFFVGLVWFAGKKAHDVKHWRWPNYLILVLGGAGLWALLIDAQKDIGQREVQIELPRYQTSFFHLKAGLQYFRPDFCEKKFDNVDKSKNFDDMIAEQQALCIWLEKIASKIDSLSEQQARTFKIDGVSDFPRSVFFSDKINLIRERYVSFDKARNILLSAEKRKDIDEMKIWFAAIGPILLGIALALSLAKAWYVP
jgi:hypothetical protein